MSEEIFLEGKNYVSSKRAAEQTGYAQDYIGQLARKGLIEAQRVGGLWYVTVDSLSKYQQNAAAYAPQVPAQRPQKEIDSVVNFDGKDYISASRAAKITGYNQDYIGQLARSGRILSRQIGNRWYVDRDMLLGHKSQKDALLAAVQAESVGIVRPDRTYASQSDLNVLEEAGPMLTYFTESEKDLLPVLKNAASRPDALQESASSKNVAPTPVSIRRITPVQSASSSVEGVRMPQIVHERRVRRPGKTMRRATIGAVALTFVIVLSYGWSGLKDHSVYTVNAANGGQRIDTNTLAASAAEAADRAIGFIEKWIVPQLHYTRQ